MNLKHIPYIITLPTLLLLTHTAYAQHQAHVHGVSHMDITLEDDELHIDFHSPLANLVHFEHQPNTDKERQAISTMASQLRQSNAIITVPASAQCKLQSITLTAHNIEPALLGEISHHAHHHAHEKQHEDNHSDLDGEYVYRCTHPENITYIDIKLLAVFSGIQQLNIQAVTPTRQQSVTLTSTNKRIQLK